MKPLGICAGSLGPPLTSDPKLVAGSSRNAFSHGSRGQKPKIKASAGLRPLWKLWGEEGSFLPPPAAGEHWRWW